MSPEAIAYLHELAADIAAHGGLQHGQSIADAIQAAHWRRQAFAKEMIAGRTDRSRMVRQVLAAKIRADACVRQGFAACQQIAENTFADRLRAAF